MNVYVVMRFDPMQCGACGNGNLDRIFMTEESAEAYIAMAKKPGVSWEIKEMAVEARATGAETDTASAA